MVKNISADRRERLDSFLQAVEAAQKLQDDILRCGLEAAYLYAEDVDGDWLQKWQQECQNNFVASVTTFLSSNDCVALRVRKQLKDKSLSEIATELEDCLSLTEGENRIFAIKTLLVDSLNDQSISDESDTVDLFELAEQLNKKLAEITSNVV